MFSTLTQASGGVAALQAVVGDMMATPLWVSLNKPMLGNHHFKVSQLPCGGLLASVATKRKPWQPCRRT
jgi:hypothetical protein